MGIHLMLSFSSIHVEKECIYMYEGSPLMIRVNLTVLANNDEISKYNTEDYISKMGP